MKLEFNLVFVAMHANYRLLFEETYLGEIHFIPFLQISKTLIHQKIS